MDAKFVEEYRFILKEMQETRACITDYMKMFFSVTVAVAAGAAALIAYGATKNPPVTSFTGLIEPYVPVIGFIVLFLSYSILTFSTILFHKFNTHNRYAGYARTLEMEDISPSQDTGIFLWETGIGAIYKPGDSIAPIDVERAAVIANLRSKICEMPLVHFPITVFAVMLGFVMMIRSTVFRHLTTSWTYPYQVSFGLFAPTLLLTLFWLTWVFGRLLLPEVSAGIADAQIGLEAFLLVSWMGLAFRLYRLCAREGDRTIESYNQKFMVGRGKEFAARRRHLTVTYYGTRAKPGRMLRLYARWFGHYHYKTHDNDSRRIVTALAGEDRIQPDRAA